MHFGRSLLISLVLCIVFFVLLRPEPPVEKPVSGPVETIAEPSADSAFAPSDSLPESPL